MGHVRFVLIFTMSLIIQSAAASSGFEGAPDLQPIEDSFLERYRTTSEFIYRQNNGRVWVVPSESLVDGRGSRGCLSIYLDLRCAQILSRLLLFMTIP